MEAGDAVTMEAGDAVTREAGVEGGRLELPPETNTDVAGEDAVVLEAGSTMLFLVVRGIEAVASVVRSAA